MSYFLRSHPQDDSVIINVQPLYDTAPEGALVEFGDLKNSFKTYRLIYTGYARQEVVQYLESSGKSNLWSLSEEIKLAIASHQWQKSWPHWADEFEDAQRLWRSGGGKRKLIKIRFIDFLVLTVVDLKKEGATVLRVIGASVDE